MYLNLHIEIPHIEEKLSLCKYLLHHFQHIFIQGPVMFKNNSVYFLAIYTYLPFKTEKFELEFASVVISGAEFYFQGSH